jgi:hypothetical protein
VGFDRCRDPRHAGAQITPPQTLNILAGPVPRCRVHREPRGVVCRVMAPTELRAAVAAGSQTESSATEAEILAMIVASAPGASVAGVWFESISITCCAPEASIKAL